MQSPWQDQTSVPGCEIPTYPADIPRELNFQRKCLVLRCCLKTSISK